MAVVNGRGSGGLVVGEEDIVIDDGFRGSLFKRKDFLHVEEEAKLHPDRTYYFRKPVDLDKMIDHCSRKLSENGDNAKALVVRAGCFAKKKMFARAVDDLTAALALAPDDAAVLYSRGAAFDELSRTNDAIVRL